jgi:hypothetical protein
VAATQSSAGMRLYVDGQLIGTNANTVAETTTGYWRIGFDGLIGWWQEPTSYYFAGSMSDAAVYHTARTATDVFTHYIAGISTVSLPTPTNFTGTPADTSVALTWSDVAGETGYSLEKSTDNATWGTPVTVAANATSYTFTSLSSVTQYYFRIRATGTGGGVSAYATTNAKWNATNYSIPDNNSTGIYSDIAVVHSGNAPTNLAVRVDITHTYKGDLIVDLIAPDGTVYNLHNRTGSGTNDIHQTYTVNASSELDTGTWRLRVRDLASQDTGTLTAWGMVGF